MDTTTLVILIVLVMSACLGIVVALILSDRRQKLQDRLEGLRDERKPVQKSAGVPQAIRLSLPKMGKHLMPDDAEEQSKLKARLIHAGLYHPQALPIFLGVKMIVILTPVTIGLLLGLVGLVPTNYGLMAGACASIIGILGPSLWLDRRKTDRQKQLRRALPDVLDLMVVCMEAGLSMRAALQRVANELAVAHPLLSFELKIVLREIQLGAPLGDALRNFGVRADLDDIRNLAAAIKNAERFGSSMVSTLKIFSETLRTRRQQKAEEMAQKAGTKILIPTLLFIFPAVFLVILGPGVIQIIEVFGNMND